MGLCVGIKHRWNPWLIPSHERTHMHCEGCCSAIHYCHRTPFLMTISHTYSDIVYLLLSQEWCVGWHLMNVRFARPFLSQMDGVDDRDHDSAKRVVIELNL